jgi:hypothetical protein
LSGAGTASVQNALFQNQTVQQDLTDRPSAIG